MLGVGLVGVPTSVRCHRRSATASAWLVGTLSFVGEEHASCEFGVKSKKCKLKKMHSFIGVTSEASRVTLELLKFHLPCSQ